MNSLSYIVQKYDLDISQNSPVEIPDIGRNNLPELFVELGFETGVEIGVQQGLYTEVLCKSGLKIFAVDPWETYKNYRTYVAQIRLDRYYNEAKIRLEKYDCDIIKNFSMVALEGFEDESLDFVYIDGNHDFQNVTNDIHEWGKKIKNGGIISGDDYVNRRQPTRTHVISVLHGYTKSYRIHPWFILGTKEQIPGIIRDKIRSWMWVKDESLFNTA